MSITIPENSLKHFVPRESRTILISRFLDDIDFRSLRAVSENTGGWIFLYECQNTFTLQKLLSTFNAPVLGSFAVRDNIQPIEHHWLKIYMSGNLANVRQLCPWS
jgi:hypothetical protein